MTTKTKTIFDLAAENGADLKLLDGNMAALDFIATKYNALADEENLTLFRATLKEELLINKLLGDEQDIQPALNFYGSGDSGNIDEDPAYPPALNTFFTVMVEQNVHFDWYNNDGGGGDITWNLKDDKVIINGYYHVTESVNAMVEEEF